MRKRFNFETSPIMVYAGKSFLLEAKDSDQAIPGVEIEWHEIGTNLTARFIGFAIAAAGGSGNESFVELWNPATSGKVLKITSLTIDDGIYSFKIKHHTSQQGSGGVAGITGNKLAGGIASSGVLYGASAASISGTQVFQLSRGAGAAGGSGSELSKLLITGQTVSYATGDDGDLELGVPKNYTILSTGQYSGTSNIVINGKTHALSNNCVKDNRTGLMWARHVPTADIGPAADGKLFWEQWTLANKTDISFDAATKVINSVAGEFDTGALCVGRKVPITGAAQAGNNQTVTVVAITANNMTVNEAIVNEAAGASVSFATVDDLIWDALAQANANNLGGYADWRIPNDYELASLVNKGNCSPAIDTTVFPSTPSLYHWTSSTHPCNTPYAFIVHFSYGIVNVTVKQVSKYYVRFVRG